MLRIKLSTLLIVFYVGNALASQGGTPISLLDFEPAKVNASIQKDYYASSKTSAATDCRLFKKHKYSLKLMKSMSKWILLHPDHETPASLVYTFEKPITSFSFIPHNAHPNGSVTFLIYADGKLVRKLTVQSKDAPKQVNITLKGCKELKLENSMGYKHAGSMAVWKSPKVTY